MRCGVVRRVMHAWGGQAKYVVERLPHDTRLKADNILKKKITRQHIWSAVLKKFDQVRKGRGTLVEHI